MSYYSKRVSQSPRLGVNGKRRNSIKTDFVKQEDAKGPSPRSVMDAPWDREDPYNISSGNVRNRVGGSRRRPIEQQLYPSDLHDAHSENAEDKNNESIPIQQTSRNYRQKRIMIMKQMQQTKQIRSQRMMRTQRRMRRSPVSKSDESVASSISSKKVPQKRKDYSIDYDKPRDGARRTNLGMQKLEDAFVGGDIEINLDGMPIIPDPPIALQALENEVDDASDGSYDENGVGATTVEYDNVSEVSSLQGSAMTDSGSPPEDGSLGSSWLPKKLNPKRHTPIKKVRKTKIAQVDKDKYSSSPEKQNENPDSLIGTENKQENKPTVNENFPEEKVHVQKADKSFEHFKENKSEDKNKPPVDQITVKINQTVHVNVANDGENSSVNAVDAMSKNLPKDIMYKTRKPSSSKFANHRLDLYNMRLQRKKKLQDALNSEEVKEVRAISNKAASRNSAFPDSNSGKEKKGNSSLSVKNEEIIVEQDEPGIIKTAAANEPGYLLTSVPRSIVTEIANPEKSNESESIKAEDNNDDRSKANIKNDAKSPRSKIPRPSSTRPHGTAVISKSKLKSPNMKFKMNNKADASDNLSIRSTRSINSHENMSVRSCLSKKSNKSSVKKKVDICDDVTIRSTRSINSFDNSVRSSRSMQSHGSLTVNTFASACTNRSTLQRLEERVKEEKQKSRKIKLLHHALTCSHPLPSHNEENYKPCCKVRYCHALKVLVKHVQGCSHAHVFDDECEVPGCSAYKAAWIHYRECAINISGRGKNCKICCDIWHGESIMSKVMKEKVDAKVEEVKLAEGEDEKNFYVKDSLISLEAY